MASKFDSNNSPSVLYIAGYERSGSTILDIIIGNHKNYFSCGEISFFSVNGLLNNEYCSCGEKVKECCFWGKVGNEWSLKRKLSIEEYNRVQHNFLRNKRAHLLFWQLISPGKLFQYYLSDTRLLYDIIWETNGGKIIIDSSKSPYRLIVLRKIGINLSVIHIIRKLSGVLFSTNKTLKMDLQNGIEKEIRPRKSWHVIFTRFICNFWVKLFTLFSDKKVIHYEDMLKNPNEIFSDFFRTDVKFEKIISARGPFKALHLVAGGRVRMKQNIRLDEKLVETENIGYKGIKRKFISMFDWI